MYEVVIGKTAPLLIKSMLVFLHSMCGKYQATTRKKGERLKLTIIKKRMIVW